MSFRYGNWTVDHALPVGTASRVEEGAEVRAGDVLASGASVGAVHLVNGAGHVGVAASDIAAIARVRPVADVRRGAVLARTGQRFARAATSPIDGRLLHMTVDGDFCVAPILAPWEVRSAIDGTVRRSDAAVVSVEGECWALQGIAGYGPDAVGTLALGVASGDEALAPTKVDVRLRDRILVAGSRIAAEAITRAHACGLAGIVAGAVPAGGLRVVYGDDVDAHGGASAGDRPTVLCLFGFGSALLPGEVWDALSSIDGERAAIHTASARLFVFAGRTRIRAPKVHSRVALADDHASLRVVGGDEDPAVPETNALPVDAER